jgi:hypothetical protein
VLFLTLVSIAVLIVAFILLVVATVVGLVTLILIIVAIIAVTIFFSQAINRIVEDLMIIVASRVVRQCVAAESGMLLKGRVNGPRSGCRLLTFDVIFLAIVFRNTSERAFTGIR